MTKDTTKNQNLSTQAAAKPPAPTGFVFDQSNVARFVSRPVLSYKEPMSTIGFQIESEMYEGKKIDGSDKAPATLVDVIDLSTGLPAAVVVGAVLKSELEQLGDYVGRCYALQNTGTKKSRQDNNVTLIMLAELWLEACEHANASLHPGAPKG